LFDLVWTLLIGIAARTLKTNFSNHLNGGTIMFKFDNPSVNFLDQLASTCDPRDQQYQDIQQAKLGLKPSRPLLVNYLNEMNPLDQSWQDLNSHLNQVDFMKEKPAFPVYDPVDVEPVLGGSTRSLTSSLQSSLPTGSIFNNDPFKFKL
jgi:hypothetical protein